MTDVRILLAAAAVAVAGGLSGCGPYGLKGDRGLPPPPEPMAYPNVNLTPSEHEGRRAKSVAEQERLKQNLIASRPRTARSPAPFSGERELREQREKARRASTSP
ncbi:hypothetical protein [Methylopila sp. M107]|uniref:hypothetical protein n=1 Tax=Methylopila sp. M107 TaxID=1101190 RepID=UPI00036C7ACC|nr:hypothetical protein [Methylopila sp. M107]